MHLLLPSTEGPLDNAGRADVAQQVERGERPPDYAEEEAKCKYRLQLHVNDDLGIIIKDLCFLSSIWGEGPRCCRWLGLACW